MQEERKRATNEDEDDDRKAQQEDAQLAAQEPLEARQVGVPSSPAVVWASSARSTVPEAADEERDEAREGEQGEGEAREDGGGRVGPEREGVGRVVLDRCGRRGRDVRRGLVQRLARRKGWRRGHGRVYADGVGVCWEEGPIACCCLLRPDESPASSPRVHSRWHRSYKRKQRDRARERDRSPRRKAGGCRRAGREVGLAGSHERAQASEARVRWPD